MLWILFVLVGVCVVILAIRQVRKNRAEQDIDRIRPVPKTKPPFHPGA